MITITENAKNKLTELMLSEEKAVFLRIGVQAGGCIGFSYGLRFDEEVREGDIEFKKADISIIVDEESKKYLEGTIIDYKESMLGTGFIINNPNAITRCGCGSSFETAEVAGKPSRCRKYRL